MLSSFIEMLQRNMRTGKPVRMEGDRFKNTEIGCDLVFVRQIAVRFLVAVHDAATCQVIG